MAERKDVTVVVESTTEKAAQFAGVLLQSAVCAAVARRGACAVALAGGTTPYLMYQGLAAAQGADLPWGAMDLFFGDERDVPHDNVESNYYMVRRAFLDNVPIDPSRVHPMQADASDGPAAAAEYEALIRRIVPDGNGLPGFDVILLGMGSDGHTASLFRCTPDALRETQKLVISHFVPVLGRKRMSFTLPLINAAHSVVMLVTGIDKADAVSRLLQDGPPPLDLPAAHVRPTVGHLTLVMDAAAARNTDHKPQ